MSQLIYQMYELLCTSSLLLVSVISFIR